MKRLLFVLLLSAAALRADAQVVQSAVTSVVEEKVSLKMHYRGFVEIGLGGNITDDLLLYEATTTHGVLLSSGTFVGAGIGIVGTTKQMALPLYLEARQFFGRHRDRGLFVGARIGYNCSLKKDFYTEYRSNYYYESNSYYFYDTYKMKGLLFSPGIGFAWKKLNVSVNYLLSRELNIWSQYYNYQGYSTPEHSYPRYKSSLLLRAGIRF